MTGRGVLLGGSLIEESADGNISEEVGVALLLVLDEEPVIHREEHLVQRTVIILQLPEQHR